MDSIVPLLACLDPVLSTTLRRQLSRIAVALLTMTGRVTMRGMARWTDQGGSYRTLQRFFRTVLPWASLFWLFFRTHCFAPDDVYLLGGDEVVVTKAGKHTHGLDRFFSSLYGKPIPGVAFFALSLISTRERHSYPIRVEQVVRSPAERTDTAARRRRRKSTAAVPPGKPGRPKGRKTTDKTAVTLTPELQRIQGMVHGLLQMIGGVVPRTYLVLDGHFGTNNAVQMVRQCDLHLISKLRADAALYLRYDGPYAGHGPHRTYGDKVDYRALPDRYRHETTVEGEIETRIYQMEVLHKEFAQALNVVILVKTNLTTQAHAHVVLVSSDLTLPWQQWIEYYCLRFQIDTAPSHCPHRALRSYGYASWTLLPSTIVPHLCRALPAESGAPFTSFSVTQRGHRSAQPAATRVISRVAPRPGYPLLMGGGPRWPLVALT